MPPRNRNPKAQITGSVPKQPAAARRAPKTVRKGGSLMINNLPGDVTLKDVEELFKITIGPLTACKLVYDANGVFDGTALVTFVAENDAVRAWEMYNGKKIDQKTPLDLLLLYSSPPTVAQPSTAALPNNNRQPPNPASLFNLKPFPAKQLKAPKAVPLTGRLGPAVIPLEQRLGPVVGGPVSAPGTLSSSIGKIANKKKVNKKRGSRKSQGGMDGIEVL